MVNLAVRKPFCPPGAVEGMAAAPHHQEIEEVRFRNVRSGEGGPAIVGTGSEEVRFRNVKMRQKRPRPSAGRPKSEVSFSQEYLQKSQHCTRREVFLGEPFRNRVPIQNFSLVHGSLARILILNP